MKSIQGIGLQNVKDVYNGPEGVLWELLMGRQIHIGGFASSMALAQKAGVKPGTKGVDFCCCSGAGMLFLVRFFDAAHVTGVDATGTVIELGKQRTAQQNLSNRISFVLADVCESGLESESADFIWGQDAWCYVEDKPRMITEAARIVKSGGVIAFTDWVEGPAGLNEVQAERFLKFMKFPNVLNIGEYRQLLEKNGCKVTAAEDTKLFAPCMDLYLDMVEKQLAWDVLTIIGFDTNMMNNLTGEMKFMQQLAHAGNIAQSLFVARKK